MMLNAPANFRSPFSTIFHPEDPPSDGVDTSVYQFELTADVHHQSHHSCIEAYDGVRFDHRSETLIQEDHLVIRRLRRFISVPVSSLYILYCFFKCDEQCSFQSPNLQTVTVFNFLENCRFWRQLHFQIWRIHCITHKM